MIKTYQRTYLDECVYLATVRNESRSAWSLLGAGQDAWAPGDIITRFAGDTGITREWATQRGMVVWVGVKQVGVLWS